MIPVTAHVDLLNAFAKAQGFALSFSLKGQDLAVSLRVHGVPAECDLSAQPLGDAIGISVDAVKALGINVSRLFRSQAQQTILSELAASPKVQARLLASGIIEVRATAIPLVVTGIRIEEPMIVIEMVPRVAV